MRELPRDGLARRPSIKHSRPFLQPKAQFSLFESYIKQRVSLEPGWRAVDRYTAAELPARHRYWLLDDGSLTSRIIAGSRGNFRVQRLYQGWQVPLPSERNLLGLPRREVAIIREVILFDTEQPVVFARSVFPLSFLSGSFSHLRRLKTKPLGAILFKHPGMRRSPFELAHMPGNCDYLPGDIHQPHPAWARRSRFSIEGKSLMVSEAFLEGFKPWPNMAPVHRTGRGKVGAANNATKQ